MMGSGAGGRLAADHQRMFDVLVRTPANIADATSSVHDGW